MSIDKERLIQIVKYLAVGGGTALLELILFQLFYAALDWNSTVANVSAIIIATVANFLLNRGVAFKSSSNFVRSALLYTLLFAFNTCFSSFVIWGAIYLQIPALVGKIAAMCCTITWNYILYRRVIFR